MKINKEKYNRKTQSIFEVNEEELRNNLLKYDNEKDKVKRSLENMSFKNYWVI